MFMHVRASLAAIFMCAFAPAAIAAEPHPAAFAVTVASSKSGVVLSSLRLAVMRYKRSHVPGRQEQRYQVAPLHWAALTDQADALRSLIQLGNDPDGRDSEGRTPLMVAAAFDSREAAAVLLANGAEPGAQDTANGNTPLDFAAMAGNVEIAQLLLAHGADLTGRARENGEGPLHYASLYGQSEMIEFLISRGVDVDIGDNAGVRPLQYARARQQGLAVQKLLSVGARPDDLPDAVNAGDIAHVQLLLARGSNVNTQGLFGTPVHLAAATGQTFLAVMLIDAGADLETEGDPAGARPLHLAASGNHVGVARLLIQRGARIDSRDAQGRTPLALAAAYGKVEVAEALLQGGADANAPDIYGHTPMHLAAGSGDLEMVDLLMSFGVDINTRSGYNGETPIYTAICGSLEMVRFLLENGADLNVSDNAGRTPLQAALSPLNSPGVVELLRQASAQR